MFRLCHRLFSSLPRFANLLPLPCDRVVIRELLKTLQASHEHVQEDWCSYGSLDLMVLFPQTQHPGMNFWGTALGHHHLATFLSLSLCEDMEHLLVPQHAH